MSAEPARYAPMRPFPPYAFLPGVDPHPTRSSRGHSYGAQDAAAVYLPAASWRENEDYRFGLDLYNHGYLWEAHEAWEAIWHAARSDELQAEFIQGLIQCAAAMLKLRMQEPRGASKLATQGTARLEGVAGQAGEHYMGLEVAPLIAAWRTLVAQPSASHQERPLLVLAE